MDPFRAETMILGRPENEHLLPETYDLYFWALHALRKKRHVVQVRKHSPKIPITSCKITICVYRQYKDKINFLSLVFLGAVPQGLFFQAKREVLHL